jgi:hypothetical protein
LRLAILLGACRNCLRKEAEFFNIGSLLEKIEDDREDMALGEQFEPEEA